MKTEKPSIITLEIWLEIHIIGSNWQMHWRKKSDTCKKLGETVKENAVG